MSLRRFSEVKSEHVPTLILSTDHASTAERTCYMQRRKPSCHTALNLTLAVLTLKLVLDLGINADETKNRRDCESWRLRSSRESALLNLSMLSLLGCGNSGTGLRWTEQGTRNTASRRQRIVSSFLHEARPSLPITAFVPVGNLDPSARSSCFIRRPLLSTIQVHAPQQRSDLDKL